MKKNYSLGKTKTHDPLASEKGMAKQKRPPASYTFNGLKDTPKGIHFHRTADGFVVSGAAPNYGKAMGMFLTTSVPASVLYLGLGNEEVDPLGPVLIGGGIIAFFFLAGLYSLLRRHKLVVRGREFTLSSGLGFLAFRQKEKLSELRGAYVSRKVRSGPARGRAVMDFVVSSGTEDGRFSTCYLGVVLRNGQRLNSLEGMSKLGLHYVSYALKVAATGKE